MPGLKDPKGPRSFTEGLPELLLQQLPQLPLFRNRKTKERPP